MDIETLLIWTLKGIAFGFGALIGCYIFWYLQEKKSKLLEE